jgi:hypothetical protein
VTRRGYAAAALIVLLVEIAIALFVRDTFVRPHLGDALAVILVYLVLRAGTPFRITPSSAIAFATACAIEVGQRFHMVDRLRLGDIRAARVILGTGYDPRDFLAYAAGAIALLVAEHLRARMDKLRPRPSYSGGTA